MKQSIKNGQRVYCNYNNRNGKVTSLATYSQLGIRDYEYYDLKYDDGTYGHAISGFHLTDI